MKLVSVIILNWNGADLLRRYLPTVVKYTNPALADVIVVDNGSTDASLKVLRDEFPNVPTQVFAQNYGFAEGYNRAIAAVDTPYVVLLNSDVACAENWLEPMISYSESHPEVGAMQPKLLSDRDRTMFEYAGAAGGFLDSLGYPYCRGRIFDSVEKDKGQYDNIIPIMWATGACLFVRRELYLKAGGLDVHFFAHMEEIDLCWRMRRLGAEIVCIPQSHVYHLGGASLAMGHPRKTYLNFRNSLLMLWKNLPKEQRNSVVLKRKLLDFVAACNFLAHGQWPHVKAIWKAHRESARMIHEIYEPEYGSNSQGSSVSDAVHSADEKQNQKNRIDVFAFEQSKISILAAYYLKGKKKYSDIFGV